MSITLYAKLDMTPGGDFRIKNLNQTDAMSCQLTARYLVIG